MNTALPTDALDPIASRTVTGAARLRFLPRLFRQAYLAGEATVYDVAARLSADYCGGGWIFVEADNGGAYLHPDTEESYTVSVNSNGYGGTLSAQAFGIVCTLMALNHLTWRAHERRKDTGMAELMTHLVNAQERLKDLAAEHADGGKIYRAID